MLSAMNLILYMHLAAVEVGAVILRMQTGSWQSWEFYAYNIALF